MKDSTPPSLLFSQVRKCYLLLRTSWRSFIHHRLSHPLENSHPPHHHDGKEKKCWPLAMKPGRSPHHRHLPLPTNTPHRHHHLLKPNKKGPYPRPAKNGRRRQIPRTTRQTMSPSDSQRRVPQSLPQSVAHAPPQSLAHAPRHNRQHHHDPRKGSRGR